MLCSRCPDCLKVLLIDRRDDWIIEDDEVLAVLLIGFRAPVEAASDYDATVNNCVLVMHHAWPIVDSHVQRSILQCAIFTAFLFWPVLVAYDLNIHGGVILVGFDEAAADLVEGEAVDGNMDATIRPSNPVSDYA